MTRKFLLIMPLLLLLATGCRQGKSASGDGEGHRTRRDGIAPEGEIRSMKTAFLETLGVLDSTLLSLQETDPGDPDYGGLWCPACKLYHTRAAEAVYPLAYLGTMGEDPVLISAAVRLGDWLLRQQEEDGSWKETPEEWTGTTTDQCLMMALAYPLLEEQMTEDQRNRWLQSLKRAGDWLMEHMDPGFASINYVATTAATHSVLNGLLPDPAYGEKARSLARSVAARMDGDGFITGEGGRVEGIKYGVDLIYNMEMSLWGLGLYARETGDKEVYDKTLASLYSHLPFIKPDGSMDGSWGIRSNKWTCYGGVTSDGCQVLFSLFAGRDDVFRTAALRNLEYLRTCITGGMVGYGPLHDEIMHGPPCIYPTFTKAKNLAMATAFCTADTGPLPPLPSDSLGIRYFPTLNVYTVRTAAMHGTVTAYGYKDPEGLERKYMYRPSGGVISNLWVEGYGFLQASSQSEYHRWEPMSFPVMPPLMPLTHRIGFTRGGTLYSTLYEYDATTGCGGEEGAWTVDAFGQLKDRDFREGGVGYSFHYVFGDNRLEKTVRLRYYEVPDTVRITEPLILYPGARVVQTSENTLTLSRGDLRVELRLTGGNALLSEGPDPERYISCFPALKAYPAEIVVIPSKGAMGDEIRYEFTITKIGE